MQAKLQLQQKQVLAPQMIQAIEILQFPAVNLLDYVEQQLNDNEALELDVPAEAEARADEEETADDGPTTAEIKEYSPDDWQDLRPRRVSSDDRDRKLEALNNTAGKSATLQDMLAEQIGLLDAAERIKELAVVLIYNLDDKGYLSPHRFVGPLLDATDEHGYLQKPLGDVVASVDGVAAIKIPKAKRGVTPEQIAAAEEARDRNIIEAQQVLSRVQLLRAGPGGAELTRNEVLLRYPLVEILERERRDWTLDDAERALALVQSLEPRGIGGRTLSETLVLQLDETDLLYKEKRALLENHLEDLEKNRLQRVARDMGLEISDVQLILEELRGRLQVAPGGVLAPVSARTVHPDVVVEQNDEGEYMVDLVNSYLPPLAVSAQAVRMAGDKDLPQRVRDVFRRQVDSARWLIEAIQQRQQTLTRVAQRIFHHQRAFLDHGENALRPLKMQTVADELGIHVSTVSRAIADKYAQTPQGVKSLKFFFTGGTETASGGVESRHTVKNKVKAIIEAEDPKSPLSDDDVAAKLKERGLGIARRTVTKYRKQLGIPSSRQRRQWS